MARGAVVLALVLLSRAALALEPLPGLSAQEQRAMLALPQVQTRNVSGQLWLRRGPALAYLAAQVLARAPRSPEAELARIRLEDDRFDDGQSELARPPTPERVAHRRRQVALLRGLLARAPQVAHAWLALAYHLQDLHEEPATIERAYARYDALRPFEATATDDRSRLDNLLAGNLKEHAREVFITLTRRFDPTGSRGCLVAELTGEEAWCKPSRERARAPLPDPDSGEEQVNRLVEQRRWAEAEALADVLVSEDDYEYAYYLRAVCRLGQGDVAGARRLAAILPATARVLEALIASPGREPPLRDEVWREGERLERAAAASGGVR